MDRPTSRASSRASSVASQHSLRSRGEPAEPPALSTAVKKKPAKAKAVAKAILASTQPEPEATPIATVPISSTRFDLGNIDMSKRKSFEFPTLDRRDVSENSSFETPRALFERPSEAPIFGHPTETPSNSMEVDMLKMQIKLLEEQARAHETEKGKAEALAHMQGARAERYKKNFAEAGQSVLHLQEEVAHLRTATEQPELPKQPRAPEQPETSQPRGLRVSIENKDSYRAEEPIQSVEDNLFGNLHDNLCFNSQPQRSEPQHSERQRTAETAATDIGRPCGEKPTFSLGNDENDVDLYSIWRFAVDEKLRIDSTFYPNDSSKILYALKYMSKDIFKAMSQYATYTKNMTYPAFMKELEMYLGIHFLKREVKRELTVAKQDKNESVTVYYQRLLPLWIHAETPEEDRVIKLQYTLLPYISKTFSHETFHSVTEVLEMTRRKEHGNKKIDFTFDRARNNASSTSGNKSGNSSNTGTSSRLQSGTTALSKDAVASGSASDPPAGTNRRPRFLPSNTKPDG